MQVKGIEKHNIRVVTQNFRTVDFHVKQTENCFLFISFPQKKVQHDTAIVTL